MSNLIQTSDLGAPNIRTSTSHKVYTWRSLKFWAEGGRIKIVNEKTGDYHSCSRKDFLERAESFARAIAKMRYGSDRRDHHDLLGLQVKCMQDAKAQGDPHDPEQLREMLAQGRNRIVFGSFGGAGGNGSADIPVGYPLDRTPRYPDGTPFFHGAEGTTLLPAR